jgi:hypothetical protein
MGRPGAETHDGFFLRLQLGGGFTTMSASAGSSSISVSGGGAAFGASFGGAVAPNVVLYGAVMDSLATNPEVKVNGTSLGNGDGSAGVVGFGPGIGFYFEPSNIFLGATLLLSKLVIDDKDGNKVGESEWGATFAGQVGKEWWVSDNWGLGVSAQLMLGAMKDKEPIATGVEVPTWTVAAFSLLFSATYN